jgi:hypothetical protein
MYETWEDAVYPNHTELCYFCDFNQLAKSLVFNQTFPNLVSVLILM